MTGEAGHLAGVQSCSKQEAGLELARKSLDFYHQGFSNLVSRATTVMASWLNRVLGTMLALAVLAQSFLPTHLEGHDMFLMSQMQHPVGIARPGGGWDQP